MATEPTADDLEVLRQGMRDAYERWIATPSRGSEGDREELFGYMLEAVIAYHKQALAALLREATGDPPVSMGWVEVVRKSNPKGGYSHITAVDTVARLLHAIDYLRGAVLFHARESGHLEEYRRGVADGRREMGERCVRAAEEADDTEYNTSAIVGAVRGEVAKG